MADDAEEWWPCYVRRIEALEEVYRLHFPQTEIDQCEEAVWIYEEVLELPLNAWDHDRVSDQIADLALALRILSRLDELPRGVMDAIILDATFRDHDVVKLLGPESSPRNAALLLPRLQELLLPSIRAAKLATLKGHRKGRTKWDAVKTIDALRASWSRCAGIGAPSGSDLNLDSPFGKFVHDAFKALEVDGKPRSAMAAWHRVQSKAEKN